MGAGRKCHHSRIEVGGRRCEKSGLKELKEEEVGEVVGAELSLKAIGCLTLWGRHHAGIIDKDIQTLALLQKSFGSFAHALERIEINLQ